MPSNRGCPPSPSRRDHFCYLRARLYSSRQPAAVWRDVQTQVPRRPRGPGGRPSKRYPWVEGLFEDRFIQPFIHDTRITFIEDRQAHHYVLFCQNHLHLPLNATLEDLWRGDIVVMRVGRTNGEFINMRSDDAARVDNVVSQFIHQVKQNGRFHLRDHFSFFEL